MCKRFFIFYIERCSRGITIYTKELKQRNSYKLTKGLLTKRDDKKKGSYLRQESKAKKGTRRKSHRDEEW